MSNITYTRKGSATTRKIAEAPVAIQKVWEKATGLGVNVLRVRVAQERHEITRGNTFDGFHQGKVSIYKQPIDALWFRRFVKLNESNKGMQVLEVADNMDVQNTLEVIDTFNKYENGGIIVRILRAIRSVFA